MYSARPMGLHWELHWDVAQIHFDPGWKWRPVAPGKILSGIPISCVFASILATTWDGVTDGIANNAHFSGTEHYRRITYLRYIPPSPQSNVNPIHSSFTLRRHFNPSSGTIPGLLRRRRVLQLHLCRHGLLCRAPLNLLRQPA